MLQRYKTETNFVFFSSSQGSVKNIITDPRLPEKIPYSYGMDFGIFPIPHVRINGESQSELSRETTNYIRFLQGRSGITYSENLTKTLEVAMKEEELIPDDIHLLATLGLDLYRGLVRLSLDHLGSFMFKTDDMDALFLRESAGCEEEQSDKYRVYLSGGVTKLSLKIRPGWGDLKDFTEYSKGFRNTLAELIKFYV